MKIKELSEFLKNNNVPAYRLKQIIKAIFRDGVDSFSNITTISKDLREKLAGEIKILPFSVEDVFSGKKKAAFKAILKLDDGNYIETVLICPIKDYWSVCVSSQVGCALGCKFCATGTAGLKRNLTGEEIAGQVLFWKQYIRKNNLGGRFSNVVYMGMGEPFMNYEEVKKSLKFLIDPELFDFAQRHISVSTAGLPDGIKGFAKDFPQVNLAISLVTASDELRSELMPVNKNFDLAALRKALEYYFNKSNRKVFFEYVMFKDINDQQKDADDLAGFIRTLSRPDLIHVNLICYNATAAGLVSSSSETIRGFKELLIKNKINATIRKSLGGEIDAACGQLVGSKKV